MRYQPFTTFRTHAYELLRRLPLCVSGVVLLGAASAYAGQFTITNENIIATAMYGVDGGSNTTVTDAKPSGAVDVSPQTSGTNGDVFVHAYGNDATAVFGARASGHNNHFGTGDFTLTETITNTSTIAQDFKFAFTIQPGEVTVCSNGSCADLASNTCPACVLSADLEISILKNGTQVFDSVRALNLVNNNLS
jgi:hypothetical protein